MRIRVLGGCGAWPAAGAACSGYLLEHDGFWLLVDPGYATLPRLLEHLPAQRVGAVVVTHAHPDHCADLNPLLRARILGEDPPPALPVYSLSGALDAVLALEPSPMLAGSYRLCEFDAGDRFEVGEFRVDTRLLPHFVPNAGVRVSAGGRVVAYTGDTGPSDDIALLARGVDVLLAEATYPERVPADSAAYLSSARQAGGYATAAGVGRLLLTHLWPGTDPRAALDAARLTYRGDVDVARAGDTLDLE